MLSVYLGHGKAELRQLQIAHQRDSHPVGQHQVAADDVLDQVVSEATGREWQETRSVSHESSAWEKQSCGVWLSVCILIAVSGETEA